MKRRTIHLGLCFGKWGKTNHWITNHKSKKQYTSHGWKSLPTKQLNMKEVLVWPALWLLNYRPRIPVFAVVGLRCPKLNPWDLRSKTQLEWTWDGHMMTIDDKESYRLKLFDSNLTSWHPVCNLFASCLPRRFPQSEVRSAIQPANTFTHSPSNTHAAYNGWSTLSIENYQIYSNIKYRSMSKGILESCYHIVHPVIKVQPWWDPTSAWNAMGEGSHRSHAKTYQKPMGSRYEINSVFLNICNCCNSESLLVDNHPSIPEWIVFIAYIHMKLPCPKSTSA